MYHIFWGGVYDAAYAAYKLGSYYFAGGHGFKAGGF